jgi:apolipoprotein N-acyltransferase
VYGVGAISAGLAMALVQAAGAICATGAWVVALVLLGAGGFAWVQRHCAVELCHTPAQAPKAPLKLALLQGNIPQDEKFEQGSGVPMALQWYAEQLRSETASLVVAPETAIPLLPQQLIPGYLEGLQARYIWPGRSSGPARHTAGQCARGLHQFGAGLAPGCRGGARASLPVYDKHHLVPFGEFIPPLFKWFTEMMNIPLGDFNRGALGQPSFEWQGQRIAPNICYEDLFGEELAHGLPTRPSAHRAGELQQHWLVWQHPGHRPAPADQPHARPGVRAPHGARHQHRGHRIIDHRGPTSSRLAALTAGRSPARSPTAWNAWPCTCRAWTTSTTSSGRTA